MLDFVNIANRDDPSSISESALVSVVWSIFNYAFFDLIPAGLGRQHLGIGNGR